MSDLVISFDDLDPKQTPKPHHEIPDGYNGFDWTHVDFVRNTSSHKYDDFPGLRDGTTSGHGAATMYVNSTGLVADISLAGTFTFKSAELTSYYPLLGQGQIAAVEVQGYMDGKLVDSSDVQLSQTHPTLFQPNWQNVDDIRFLAYYQNDSVYLAMDDLTLSHVKPASPPSLHEHTFAGLHLDTHAAFTPLHGAEHIAIA